MISVELQGLEEVIEELRKIPTSIDRRSAFDRVGKDFSARLRAATPPGYSRKLMDSVLYEADDEGAEVGYDQGVEVAGNSRLDSVRRPSTRGGSVLARRWVRPSELEGVLAETFQAYEATGISVMQEALTSGLS